jgi:hypothetical protein
MGPETVSGGAAGTAGGIGNELQHGRTAPVAGSLIKKYGGYEHSSVTYEKAEQLMGAVIYCIDEYEAENENRQLPEAKVSAFDAYKAGYECVVRKAKKAVTLYNQTAAIFHSYRLRCLKRYVPERPAGILPAL